MRNLLYEIISSVALQEIVDAVIPQSIEEIEKVELIIRIEDFELNVRELTVFLSFLDRVYGRAKDWDLKRYSHSPNQQLKIESVNSGSIELVISEILVYTKENFTSLVILFAAARILKPISELVKSSAESYKFIAEAKKSLSEEIKNKAESQKFLSEANKLDEEAKLIKVNRQKLEIENKTNLLSNLDKKSIDQLFRLLKKIYVKEKKHLPKIKKFADEKVKEIELKVKTKKNL